MRFLIIPLIVVVAGSSGCAAENGVPNAGVEEHPCDALIERVCGGPADGGTCDEAAACEAAALMAQYRRGDCASRLTDVDRYPTCGASPAANNMASSCNDLVTHCCGSDGAGGCSADPSCLNAREVALDGDTSVCRQALNDTTGFPRCTP